MHFFAVKVQIIMFFLGQMDFNTHFCQQLNYS